MVENMGGKVSEKVLWEKTPRKKRFPITGETLREDSIFLLSLLFIFFLCGYHLCQSILLDMVGLLVTFAPWTWGTHLLLVLVILRLNCECSTAIAHVTALITNKSESTLSISAFHRRKWQKCIPLIYKELFLTNKKKRWTSQLKNNELRADIWNSSMKTHTQGRQGEAHLWCYQP